MRFRPQQYFFNAVILIFLISSFAYAQFSSSISGHVTLDATGDPVAYFPLNITKVNPPLAGIPIPLVTDANGFYETPMPPGIPPGTYELTPVDVSFYEPFKISDIQVEADQNVVQDIVVSIQPADAEIAGNVTLEDQGVEGADVLLYRLFNSGTSLNNEGKFGNDEIQGGGATYSTVTDINGDFSIDVVHGSYFLYIPETSEYLPYWSSSLFVDEGESLPLQIELVPNPFRTISGTVSNFGIFDQVLVKAIAVSLGGASFTSIDTLTGEYSLLVTEGEYLVMCVGFLEGTPYTIYYNNVTSLDDATVLDVMDDLSGIDFNFPTDLTLSTITIQGNVTDESTGLPLEGARVGFSSENIGYDDSNHHPWEVLTDSDGNYSFSGNTFLDKVSTIGHAKKGGYFIEYYDNQPTFFTATPIEVNAGETVTDIDFSLTPIPAEPFFSISGTVLGEDGKAPYFGAVIAYSTVGIKHGEIQSDGSYIIDGFPSGTNVTLQAWGFPGYIPVIYNGVFTWKEATVLEMNEDKTDINFTLPLHKFNNAAGLISGRVNGNQGQGLSGVTLLIKKSDESEWYSSDYSDYNGQFNIPIDSYGNYDILATADGYETYQTSVEVTESTGLVIENQDIILTPTSIEDQSSSHLIRDHILYAAYPNPFNPQTIIKVDMGKTERAYLVVYNVLGQKVKILHDGILNQGTKRFVWDGTDDIGKYVASGLYFYQLTTESTIQTRSVMLMK